MLALGCNCTANRLSVIRADIAAILPDTQVEEFESIAKARAEARTAAAAQAQAAMTRERWHRSAVREEKEAFAAGLVPVVILGACVWLGLLALGNVRERRGEIGLLRALGFRSVQLCALMLARALLVGLLGALLGILAGVISITLGGATVTEVWTVLMNHRLLLVLILLASPAVSVLACWLPTLSALRQDPALVLQQEAA